MWPRRDLEALFYIQQRYLCEGWEVLQPWRVASPLGGTDWLPFCLILRRETPIRGTRELVVAASHGILINQWPRKETKL